MPRWLIVRDTREVGFLDAPSWVSEAEAAQLPGFEGADTGLAVIVELRGTPVAGVVYSWADDVIDITHPELVSWTWNEHPLSEKQASFRIGGRIYFLRYPLAVRARDGIQFLARTHVETTVWPNYFQPQSFALEIHDKDLLDVSLRLNLSEVFKVGSITASFQASERSEPDKVEGSFEGDFALNIPDSKGHGVIRGHYSSYAGEINIDVDLFQLEYSKIVGHFRFRGQSGQEEQTASSSILWLFQQIGAQFQEVERDVPFTLWIGKVKYDPAMSDLRLKATVRRALASLLENKSPSDEDLVSIMLWGEREFTVKHRDRPLRRLTLDALQKLYSAGLTGGTIRARERQRLDCKFSFDSSVPAEKALQFLILLSRALQERGGRLCIGSHSEL